MTRDSGRSHYSYAHYANSDVAAGFDALRFSGPVGRFLLEAQGAVLREALAPLAGARLLDVGTGTGRAAIALAQDGAHVLGLDASAEMLAVAASRARDAGVTVAFGLADAHRLPVADRAVDAAVCLRVLMHAIDWRACVAELCRVSRRRVILDFPALGSFAAIESGLRHVRRRLGQPVEAYRVMTEREVVGVLAQHGFRPVIVRRQFVLPIAVHKAVNRFWLTRRVEAGLAAAGLLRLCGSPVTMVAER